LRCVRRLVLSLRLPLELGLVLRLCLVLVLCLVRGLRLPWILVLCLVLGLSLRLWPALEADGGPAGRCRQAGTGRRLIRTVLRRLRRLLPRSWGFCSVSAGGVW